MNDLERLFAVASKLGGLALAAYGAQVNNIKTMTVGAAVAAVVHFIDSIFNSPKGTSPTL